MHLLKLCGGKMSHSNVGILTTDRLWSHSAFTLPPSSHTRGLITAIDTSGRAVRVFVRYSPPPARIR